MLNSPKCKVIMAVVQLQGVFSLWNATASDTNWPLGQMKVCVCSVCTGFRHLAQCSRPTKRAYQNNCVVSVKQKTWQPHCVAFNCCSQMVLSPGDPSFVQCVLSAQEPLFRHPHLPRVFLIDLSLFLSALVLITLITPTLKQLHFIAPAKSAAHWIP